MTPETYEIPEYQGWADAQWLHSVGHGPLDLVKCPQCDTWTLPADDERWCPEHGVIPLPSEKED